MSNTFRQGNTMIAVESRPAEIAFEEILDATEVVYDDCSTDAPWDNCDGYEHTVTSECRYRPDADPDTRAMQGCVYCDGHRKRVVIELPDGEDYGIYTYLRAAGASKQVAHEAVAAERRRTLAQLAKWYRGGWNWYGVKCEFEALGETYEASVWGIDDKDYAEREVKAEIASEVAYQLEKAGYTVTGQPDCQAGYNAHRCEVKQDRIRRNMAAQNWAA